MVVEPTPPVADIIRRELLKYVKVVLHDGGDGFLQTLQATSPVAVVLDMQLGEGINPYGHIQLIRTHTHARIILISDFEDKRDIIRALHSEADDYLRKPFNTEILAAVVLKRIRTMKSADGTPPQEPHANKEKVKTVVLEKRSDKLFLERLDTLTAERLADEDFDLNTMAEIMHRSRGQLYKKIRELRGVSPVEYLRNKRLERAAALLLNSQLTVQEVMQRVGMADANNFYRRFKERYGKSPTRFRNGTVNEREFDIRK